MHGPFRIQSGNPNGVIEAIAPAICYTNQGGLWGKINSTRDSNGWAQIIPESQVVVDTELLFSPLVSRDGVPTHTPMIPNQQYTQRDSIPAGLIWNWWNGSWAH